MSINALPAHRRILATGTALVIAALATTACTDAATDATPLEVGAVARNRAGGAHDMGDMAGMGGMGDAMRLKEGALYVADLHPLNARAQQALDPDPRSPHGVTEGKAYFRVVNGMLQAVVDVAGAEPAEGAFPDGLHPQHIHAAGQCPSQSADVNGDGFVDVIEGVPFYGPILVPLDGDIRNTTSEIPTFPRAMGDRGTYHYEASTPLATLEQAIGAPLALPTRHVVIHGVDLATPLPSSVQTLDGIPAQLTLPVACGEIREVR